MKPSYQKQQAGLLKKLLSALSKSVTGLERQFVEQFYGRVLVADLEKLDSRRAVAMARDIFAFFKTRAPGEPKIRVFAPTEKEHGYSSKSLVIELINDDMPFLVDSLTAELTRRGLIIRDTFHPIFHVIRDKNGELSALGDEKKHSSESLIHFEVSHLPEDRSASQIEADLRFVLAHVRAAVDGWKPILAKVEENIARLKKAPKGFDADYVAEVRDFLGWLANKNFVFLGYGEYDFITTPDKEVEIRAMEKIGVLTIPGENSHKGLEGLQSDQRQHLLSRQLIEITKANRRSLVHRRVPMDYVAIKRFDESGNVVGEVRFLGLFTSNVYYQSASVIPLLKDKIAKILDRSGFRPNSHDGKALNTILEFLPRDELFQMTEDELFEVSMGILAQEARPGVRLFVRRDVFERFMSVMVLVPREQFSTALRIQIQRIMEKAYHGVSTAFNTQITDAPLARLYIIVRTTPGDVPSPDLSKLEKDIARLTNLWSDQLASALASVYDETQANTLHQRYETAFPQAYLNRYDAQAASYDISKAEAALKSGALSLDFYQLKDEADFAHLKIYNPTQEIALSDILPMLENSGFRVIEEQPFLLDPKGTGERIWIRDFKLQLPAFTGDLADRKPFVEQSLLASWQGMIEDDRLNALVLLAPLNFNEVAMLRALGKYMRQIGFSTGLGGIETAMVNNPSIATTLVQLFHARFDPALGQRDVKIHALKSTLEKDLENVVSAVEDRILRTVSQIIFAILRTNYYQAERPILSFKFDSREVPGLPLPVPFAEIFVYSPRVEGIHLRGGKVARGGLRWSDRPDDFRTEILGLMKAQMVKNAVIVPVGSKGGFVLKKAPPATDRDAFMKEGIECYRLFLQGLLDITDNMVAGQVMPPQQVVRHDGDDPYLVVAADKGTASFSDIANAVSQSYNFWLGDAFASGGSAGYDHKEMGITARGAWISVKRHFLEKGKDIQGEDFTCVGIGDMGGDVFGNGMLLSKHTRLVAAFNHMHIFIDPEPDAAASFAERERLFKLPRSSWKDYDAALISKGGGIYERSAKMIELSPQAMLALGMTKNRLSPEELIRGILLAPVELLWNGGIGTYVKAEDETHEQVGDRANNAVRVNGRELRCKVVGEGGNLGFTQKGRIEFAKGGGAINTDAIDNSAGVDCSDHEVNIKISFAHLLSSGALGVEKRDHVLEAMTDEVAELVLKDNKLQTLALTVAEQRGMDLLDSHVHLMHALEAKGVLSRAVEYLPTDVQIAELRSAGHSLTRPEMAVLLAYGKMDLYRMLVESDLPDDPYFAAELLHYFPQAMQKDYREAILAHPLRREIIGTMLTNSLVNRMGCTFVNDVAEKHGVDARDIAASYAIVRDAFHVREYWRALDQLTGKIAVPQQVALFVKVQHFIRTMAVWLLENAPRPLVIEEIRERIIVPAQKRTQNLPPSQEAAQAAEALIQQGAPANLAHFLSNMEAYATSFDIVHLSKESQIPEEAVAALYEKISRRLTP